MVVTVAGVVSVMITELPEYDDSFTLVTSYSAILEKALDG